MHQTNFISCVYFQETGKSIFLNKIKHTRILKCRLLVTHFCGGKEKIKTNMN